MCLRRLCVCICTHIYRSRVYHSLRSLTTPPPLHHYPSLTTPLHHHPQDDIHGKHGQNTPKPFQKLLFSIVEIRAFNGWKERSHSSGRSHTQISVHSESEED